MTEFLPTNAIKDLPSTDGGNWFEYMIKVYPHHTDYSGSVWHGTYVTWLEEARVESLRSLGVEYADIVAQGCELPVVDISVHYHQPVTMGMTICIRAKMRADGIRLNWDYEIRSIDTLTLYATAKVTLVPIDSQKGKITRQLPPVLKDALTELLKS